MKDAFKSVRCDSSNPKWENCIKRQYKLYEHGEQIRSEFDRDYTRLLHCKAFSRLKHKTQVFFAPHNDHTCTRMEHVLHVASVASTTARYLGLNEGLANAIAIGHDIGHAPFGHFGEDCLNNLIKKASGQKKFWHERNSLFFADYIETLDDPNGLHQVLNLTYAVRDGLICHCGEIDQQGITPREKDIDLYSIKTPGIIQPYTWEGCVVKVADKIAYLGRDLEDARTYHIIDMASYRELREIVASTIGTNEKSQTSLHKNKAVNTTVLINDLINDLCENSSIENGLCFSDKYFSFILALKKFSYSHIYSHWRLKEFQQYAKNILLTIYHLLMRVQPYAQNGRVLQALRYYKLLSSTFDEWLIKYSNYKENQELTKKHLPLYNTKEVFDIFDNESYEKCVIEYISGMTDQFAIQVYEEIITF